jgi:hypothetical protein
VVFIANNEVMLASGVYLFICGVCGLSSEVIHVLWCRDGTAYVGIICG